jgi:hypothetical protein
MSLTDIERGHLIQCADCRLMFHPYGIWEQTTFEGTKMRCGECGDKAYDRALKNRPNCEPGNKDGKGIEDERRI